jgi:hypothetical protein
LRFVAAEKVLLAQPDSGARLRALRVAARQRHHIGVVVLIEKQKAEVKCMADLEIGRTASLTVPAFRGDLGQDPVAVGRF